MPITKEQARDVARAFLDISHALGECRFDNWDDLGPDQRKSIEDLEWSLQNMSSDLTTRIVGTELDDMGADLEALQDATTRAKAVVADIQHVKDLITVATKALALGGALISQHPDAIASAAKSLLDAVQQMG